MARPPLRLAVPLLLFAGCTSPEPEPVPPPFPADFLWGTASSAWQVEGDHDPDPSDDRPYRSNWTSWEDLGCITTGERNPQGTGFWDRYEEDFALAASLGTNAIRIGLDWARIEPEDDQWDEAALDHYAQVLAAARAAGLTPMLTLWHWVVPTFVQDPAAQPTIDLLLAPPGPDAPFALEFEEFVRHVAPVVGQEVDLYSILNETFTVIVVGYLGGLASGGCGGGAHPPGAGGIDEARTAYANLLFAHARACHALREFDDTDLDGDGATALCGTASTTNVIRPLDPFDDIDVAGAERIDWIYNHAQHHAWTTGEVDLDFDRAFTTTQSADPDLPMDEGFQPQLAGTLDWLGLNYYGPIMVDGLQGSVLGGLPVQHVDQYAPELPHSDVGFAVDPAGFGEVIRRFDRYGLPLYVTENGFGTEDDQDRPMFLVEHLDAAAAAVADGADLRGYFHWSLTDNFEWSFGWDSHFGLYGVDSTDPSMPRVPHPSATAYAELIGAGGPNDDIRTRWHTGRYATDQRPTP